MTNDNDHGWPYPGCLVPLILLGLTVAVLVIFSGVWMP